MPFWQFLVGLLAPQYTKYVEKSRKSADVTNIENVVTAIKVAASDEEFGSLATGDYVVKLTTEWIDSNSTCRERTG